MSALMCDAAIIEGELKIQTKSIKKMVSALFKRSETFLKSSKSSDPFGITNVTKVMELSLQVDQSFSTCLTTRTQQFGLEGLSLKPCADAELELTIDPLFKLVFVFFDISIGGKPAGRIIMEVEL